MNTYHRQCITGKNQPYNISCTARQGQLWQDSHSHWYCLQWQY